MPPSRNSITGNPLNRLTIGKTLIWVGGLLILIISTWTSYDSLSVGPETPWAVSPEWQANIAISCGLALIVGTLYIKENRPKIRLKGFAIILVSLAVVFAATHYVVMIGIPFALAGGVIVISSSRNPVCHEAKKANG